jgi:hypothetical protein
MNKFHLPYNSIFNDQFARETIKEDCNRQKQYNDLKWEIIKDNIWLRINEQWLLVIIEFQ